MRNCHNLKTYLHLKFEITEAQNGQKLTRYEDDDDSVVECLLMEP